MCMATEVSNNAVTQQTTYRGNINVTKVRAIVEQSKD